MHLGQVRSELRHCLEVRHRPGRSVLPVSVTVGLGPHPRKSRCRSVFSESTGVLVVAIGAPSPPRAALSPRGPADGSLTAAPRRPLRASLRRPAASAQTRRSLLLPSPRSPSYPDARTASLHGLNWPTVSSRQAGRSPVDAQGVHCSAAGAASRCEAGRQVVLHGDRRRGFRRPSRPSATRAPPTSSPCRALLAANPGLFSAVQLLGIAYLLWLGLGMLREAAGAAGDTGAAAAPRSSAQLAGQASSSPCR